jgi:alpha-maltose-1-phosphate synthase
MRILAAVIIAPHLSVSGAVNAAKSLSQAVAEHCEVDVAIMGHTVQTAFLGRARLLERDTRNPLKFTEGFLPNKFRTLFYRSDIPNLIQQARYDLVHIHNPIPALEMKRVAETCVKLRIPYVVSTHGFVEVFNRRVAYGLNFMENVAGGLFIDRPLSYVIAHASMVLALSPNEYPLLVRMGIPEQKLTVVSNGFDEKYSESPRQEQIALVCSKFDLPINKAKLLQKDVLVGFFLGNHTRNKGLTILLEALPRVRTPYLLIVGGQKRSDVDYAAFERRSRQSQRTVFTDFLTEEEIASLYVYADIFILPTLADTLPLVVLNAMASGLPVLSTNVGGIPYQIDRSCGYLVEAGDPVALADAINKIAVDRHQLVWKGEQARIRVRERFSWPQSAAQAVSVYKKILNG